MGLLTELVDTFGWALLAVAGIACLGGIVVGVGLGVLL